MRTPTNEVQIRIPESFSHTGVNIHPTFSFLNEFIPVTHINNSKQVFDSGKMFLRYWLMAPTGIGRHRRFTDFCELLLGNAGRGYALIDPNNIGRNAEAGEFEYVGGRDCLYAVTYDSNNIVSSFTPLMALCVKGRFWANYLGWMGIPSEHIHGKLNPRHFTLVIDKSMLYNEHHFKLYKNIRKNYIDKIEDIVDVVYTKDMTEACYNKEAAELPKFRTLDEKLQYSNTVNELLYAKAREGRRPVTTRRQQSQYTAEELSLPRDAGRDLGITLDDLQGELTEQLRPGNPDQALHSSGEWRYVNQGGASQTISGLSAGGGGYNISVDPAVTSGIIQSGLASQPQYTDSNAFYGNSIAGQGNQAAPLITGTAGAFERDSNGDIFYTNLQGERAPYVRGGGGDSLATQEAEYLFGSTNGEPREQTLTERQITEAQRVADSWLRAPAPFGDGAGGDGNSTSAAQEPSTPPVDLPF